MVKEQCIYCKNNTLALIFQNKNDVVTAKNIIRFVVFLDFNDKYSIKVVLIYGKRFRYDPRFSYHFGFCTKPPNKPAF